MSEMINRHIATLLRRHDCVIVPGIGAFVVLHQDAAFDSESGIFTPPARLLTFNPSITHDDGLMVDSLSRRMKISFAAAREKLEAESRLMLRRLKAEGSLRIGRVGTLVRRGEGRLEFKPEACWTLQLPAIECSRTAEKPVIEILRPEPAEEKGVAVVRVPLHFRRLHAAAAAVILAIVGFAISTPIDLEHAQNASMAMPAFTPPEPVRFEPPVEPEGMSLWINASTPADAVLSIEKPKPAAPQPYIVVVASLVSKEQANKFIASAPTPGLQVVQCGDKFRVYASSGASQAEAMAAFAAQSGFSTAYPDAWVCRR